MINQFVTVRDVNPSAHFVSSNPTDPYCKQSGADSLVGASVSLRTRPQFASAGHLLNGQGAFVAGGRWNPPGRFRVNYCSLSPGTAVEEAYRLFESKGLPRAIVGNRVIATIHYELQAVWDFSRIPEGLIGRLFAKH